MNKKNEKLILKFNTRYPIGSKFRWTPRANDWEHATTLTVQTVAYDSYGQAVVFARERKGFISIEPQFVDYAYTHIERPLTNDRINRV